MHTGPFLYYDIWEKLKRDGKVSVTANRRLHARIVKAVTKKKWEDDAYKLLIYPHRALLNHRMEGPIITFTLRKLLPRNPVISITDL